MYGSAILLSSENIHPIVAYGKLVKLNVDMEEWCNRCVWEPNGLNTSMWHEKRGKDCGKRFENNTGVGICTSRSCPGCPGNFCVQRF